MNMYRIGIDFEGISEHDVECLIRHIMKKESAIIKEKWFGIDVETPYDREITSRDPNEPIDDE